MKLLNISSDIEKIEKIEKFLEEQWHNYASQTGKGAASRLRVHLDYSAKGEYRVKTWDIDTLPMPAPIVVYQGDNLVKAAGVFDLVSRGEICSDGSS